MPTGNGNAPSQTRLSVQSLQRLTKMFAALSAINEAILRTKSADELYQQVCQAALSGGNLLGTAILLREGGTEQLKFVAGAGEGIERLRTVDISVAADAPTGQGICGVAFRSRQPCVSNDLLNDVRSQMWHEGLRREGIRAAAALPLVRHSASVGVVLVFFGEVGAVDQEIVSLLTRMVENVVFALDNLDSEAARKKNERATRRLTRMYAAISATNEAILRSQSPQELYQRVCDASVRGGKSLATTVLLAEPGSPWLRSVAGSGDVMELVKTTRFSADPDNPYGGGVVGQAFRNRKLAINADILNSEQGRPWREAGLAVNAMACAAAPLIKKGQSIGVLMIFFGRSWAADEEVMALLARMAENVSFALDNFDREEERKRAETRAHHLASHDDLTDLPNRAMFSQLLSEAIKAPGVTIASSA
jgi:GAF domain-containing protein